MMVNCSCELCITTVHEEGTCTCHSTIAAAIVRSAAIK
jgi:hypothetical protein